VKSKYINHKGLACLKPGHKIKFADYAIGADIYDQFRVILTGDENKPIIINERSLYPHVVCRTDVHPQYILDNIDTINKVCGDVKNIVYAVFDIKRYDLYERNKNFAAKLSVHFNKIYLWSLAWEDPLVKTFPCGFNYNYIQHFDSRVVKYFLKKEAEIPKSKLIGTAFSKMWPHLTDKIKDRRDLNHYSQEVNLIESFSSSFTDYLTKKSEYIYFACPRGVGIQSPKIFECFLCETVPVVTDAPYARQLRDDHNLPIHIVNKWSDLNEESLLNEYDAKYKNYDWYALINRFRVKNFIREFLQ